MISDFFQALKNQGFLKYLKNTVWMLIEQFLRIFSGLLVGIWVARYLGPEKFGVFSYVLAFTSIFGSIAKLGLDGVVVRDLIKQPEKRDVYLGTSFWLKLFGALLSIFLVLCFLPFTENDYDTKLYIFIVASGVIFQSFEIVQFYFQSQVNARFVTFCKVFQIVFSSIIKVFLVIYQADLVWFIWVLFFDFLMLAIAYIWAYKVKGNPSFYLEFDLEVAKDLLKDGWPLIFAGLGFTLFSNVDSIMIKEMIDENAVGLYAAAYKLTVVWYFLPGLVLTSVMPAIVSMKNNAFEFKRRVHLVTGTLVWFAIFLAIFTTIFSDLIIRYTFGGDYSSASDLLVLLIWINVIIFFNSCWNNVHVIEGKSSWVMYFHFLTAVLNIVMNYFLIPEFGLIGAAYAILFSLFLSFATFSLVDKGAFPLLINSLFFGRK